MFTSLKWFVYNYCMVASLKKYPQVNNPKQKIPRQTTQFGILWLQNIQDQKL